MRSDGIRDAFLNLDILHSNSLLELLSPPGMLLFRDPASSHLPASYLITHWGKLGHQSLTGHSCDISPVSLEAFIPGCGGDCDEEKWWLLGGSSGTHTPQVSKEINWEDISKAAVC